jgi:hypothetical protein
VVVPESSLGSPLASLKEEETEALVAEFSRAVFNGRVGNTKLIRYVFFPSLTEARCISAKDA